MSRSGMTKPTRVRVNPSRSTCEEIIRRILTTENRENGKNRHFKTAADFMTYFESLYPPGSSLTKQVQRAIRSLGLAKDENGFFLIDKTKEEQALENELCSLLEKSAAMVSVPDGCEFVLLELDNEYRSYVSALIESNEHLRSLFITSVDSRDGLLFLTKDSSGLKKAFDLIMHQDK